MNWINDRNPEENQWCLVALKRPDGTKYTCTNTFLWMQNNFWQSPQNRYGYTIIKFGKDVIIGWMSLPEPPSASAGNGA